MTAAPMVPIVSGMLPTIALTTLLTLAGQREPGGQMPSGSSWWWAPALSPSPAPAAPSWPTWATAGLIVVGLVAVGVTAAVVISSDPDSPRR